MSPDRTTTIAAEIQFGRYDDGSGFAVYRALTGGRVNHGLIVGDAGSGKSRALNVITRRLLTQLPATLVHLDGQDGASSPELWETAAVRSGRDGASKVIDGLEEQIADRQRRQRADNSVGFVPDDDTPVVLVVLDEVSGLLDDRTADRLADLGRRGVKTGLMLLATTQVLGLAETFAGSCGLRTVLLGGNRIAMRTTDTLTREVLACHGFSELDTCPARVTGFNAPAGAESAYPSPFTLIHP
jgi:ABC-type phosphonate transport system ATPase subunit